MEAEETNPRLKGDHGAIPEILRRTKLRCNSAGVSSGDHGAIPENTG